MIACSNCLHFLARRTPDATVGVMSAPAGTHTGVCRRYPPRVFSPQWDDLGRLSVTSVFTEVHAEQGCGEHQIHDRVALLEQAGRYRADGR